MRDRSRRRVGDPVVIDGSYQYNALRHGVAAQRFWHHSKLRCIDALLPPAPGDVALDVGCGSGVITSHLGRCGARAIGIDANPGAVDFARERFAAENVSFHLGLLDEEFPLDCLVDKIYCLELIEHVYRPQALSMLERFRELLRPGGSLFVTTPNYRSMWPIIEWIMDHSGRFPAMAGAQHVAFYRGETLRALCQEAGFEVVSLLSMGVVSPWLAFVNWRAAERCLDLELRLPLLVGPVLVCVGRKRDR